MDGAESTFIGLIVGEGRYFPGPVPSSITTSYQKQSNA